MVQTSATLGRLIRAGLAAGALVFALVGVTAGSIAGGIAAGGAGDVGSSEICASTYPFNSC